MVEEEEAGRNCDDVNNDATLFGLINWRAIALDRTVG